MSIAKNNDPMWKKVPHRIRGFLTKREPSFMYRIFPQKKCMPLKHQQWGHSSTDLTEVTTAEVPLKSNLMSFFRHHQPKPNQPTKSIFKAEREDTASQIYIGTLSKLRLATHYTMEQQLSIHHMLTRLQNTTMQQASEKRRHSSSTLARDFNSLLFAGNRTDMLLLNNRKPRRTRYIFMLLSTPIDCIKERLHPVTEATMKRKSYLETMDIITAEMVSREEEKGNEHLVTTYKFVPASYLLDPTTLRGQNPDDEQENDDNRLGTKFVKPLTSMAKIQIQTN